jgi:hypothetical protein
LAEGANLGNIEDTGIEVEARRLAIEAIATLAHVKKICASTLLLPSGIPSEDVARFLNERDPSTGARRSKREAAQSMLESLGNRGLEGPILRQLVRVVADWDAFHLAQDEFDARGIVQKAKRLIGALEELDDRELRISEAAATAALQRQEKANRDRRIEVSRQLELLLQQFDAAVASEDAQQRGYYLEDLLGRLFDLAGIAVVGPFRRNNGGEQIDGAFEMESWHYIVECRWREKLADIRQLDGLIGQLSRSGKQTMGIFLSINGWSENVVPLLKQSPSKNVLLMEGFDLRTVLSAQVELRRLLKEKLSALNIRSEPYMPVNRLLIG